MANHFVFKIECINSRAGNKNDKVMIQWACVKKENEIKDDFSFKFSQNKYTKIALLNKCHIISFALRGFTCLKTFTCIKSID